MFPISLRSKRAQLALRFFTYGVMTLATVVLTALAIFYAMGYRFNRSTLVFEQGGLVQFRSIPDGAAVVVDGVLQNFKTPGRTNLPAGSHVITMQLPGYREWHRTVSVAPGQLLWLDYTRFIPDSISTVPVKTFESLHATLPSPDRHWMLMQEKADVPTFTLADFNDEKNVVFTQLALTDARLSKHNGKTGTFTVTEWDASSRYFLVRHQIGTLTEWLRVDRANADSTANLTQQFKLNVADAHFSGSNANIVYARAENTLRRLDIGANAASTPLVNGLQQFSVYTDDTVAFTATRTPDPADPTTTQQVVGLYHGNKETIVQTYSAETALLIAYSQYASHSFLAIHTGDGAVRVLRDPTSGSKENSAFASFGLGRSAQWLKISANGRMVAVGADDSVITYDLELAKSYQSKLAFLGTQQVRPPEWLDNFYLWSDMGDRLRLVEFDGQNDREITAVSPGFSVMLSQSGKTLFSVGKNSTTHSYFLQASHITVQ